MIGLPNEYDVNVQDATTRPLDLFFTEANGIPTTLSVASVIDGNELTVTDPTNFSIGDYLGVFAGDVTGNTPGTFYFADILNKVGSVLTLDTPIDTVFAIGSPVISTSRDLNVNGSVTSRTFAIQAGGTTGEISVDLTRIIFEITTTDPPKFSDFGDIALGLINGCVLRRNNHIIENILNIKSNAELANLMYDISFYDQANPQSVNGLVARMTFAGQAKHGVAIRLEPGDTFDFVIQDDLSTLLSFRLIAQGHVVQGM